LAGSRVCEAVVHPRRLGGRSLVVGQAPPPAVLSPVSLHDALPIGAAAAAKASPTAACRRFQVATSAGAGGSAARRASPVPPGQRSEEHTSELQSRENLVCRLLREKKKGAGTGAGATPGCSRGSAGG